MIASVISQTQKQINDTVILGRMPSGIVLSEDDWSAAKTEIRLLVTKYNPQYIGHIPRFIMGFPVYVTAEPHPPLITIE